MRGVVPSGSTLVVITVAPLLLACVDFEPTETAGPPVSSSQPAMLGAQLRLFTGESREVVDPPRAPANASLRRGQVESELDEESHSTVRFSASFFPGRDARGVIRTVTKDTITVLDRKIVAQEAGSTGALAFSDEWSLRLDDGEGTARLHTPDVAGREQLSPTLEFRLCRGNARYDLAISRDDTVHLEISCPRMERPAGQGHWDMTVRSADGRSVLGFSGADSPPPTVPLPALTLEHLGRSELIATLRVTEAWGQESNGDYEVFLAIASETSWTLRWE